MPLVDDDILPCLERTNAVIRQTESRGITVVRAERDEIRERDEIKWYRKD